MLNSTRYASWLNFVEITFFDKIGNSKFKPLYILHNKYLFYCWTMPFWNHRSIFSHQNLLSIPVPVVNVMWAREIYPFLVIFTHYDRVRTTYTDVIVFVQQPNPTQDNFWFMQSFWKSLHIWWCIGITAITTSNM